MLALFIWQSWRVIIFWLDRPTGLRAAKLRYFRYDLSSYPFSQEGRDGVAQLRLNTRARANDLKFIREREEPLNLAYA